MALTRRKAILFSIIPAFFVLLLLVLTEGALRLFVPSLSSPLFVQESDTLVHVNRGYLNKFFPASSPLIPELKPTVIRLPKPSGSFRVICLGESSMFGVPYEMTASIPGILRKQLRRSIPERQIDVINLAASAINTNVIKELAEGSLALQPDLIVIYTGHNEFYGPDGVGASFLERDFPFLTGWKYHLRDLRIVRLIQNMLRSVGTRNPGEQNLMKQVSNNAWVDIESDDARRVFSMFEKNLREILSTCQASHIPVIVSDVTSNLMFPPFAYPAVGPEERVRNSVTGGRLQEAEVQLQQLMTANPQNAFVWYWRGRLDLAAGNSEAAHRELSRARDFDMLKFRAPERINQITRQVCDDMHVPCLSADSLFASLSQGGIPGNTLFWEHLHPRVRGYYEIAEMFYRAAERLRYLPGTAGIATAVLPFNTDTLAICWLDLAYADLSIRGLTSRWPFENLSVEPAVFPSSPDHVKKIAMQVYTKAIGWSDGCIETAAEFHRARMFQSAVTTYQAMLDEYSEGFYTHYLMGTVLRDSGDAAGAAAHYAASIRLNPQYPFARVDLGLIEINQGQLEAARDQLTAALDLSRQQNAPPALQASIYYGLAAIDANKGNYPAALAALNQALQLLPSYTPARTLKDALERRK